MADLTAQIGCEKLRAVSAPRPAATGLQEHGASAFGEAPKTVARGYRLVQAKGSGMALTVRSRDSATEWKIHRQWLADPTRSVCHCEFPRAAGESFGRHERRHSPSQTGLLQAISPSAWVTRR